MALPRVRIFQLTRSLPFLWKTSLLVLATAIVAAALLLALAARTEKPAGGADATATWEQSAAADHSRLAGPGAPSPRQLARFFRSLAEREEDDAPAWKFDGAALRLGPLDLRVLLEKHLEDDTQREAFADFLRQRLCENPDERNAARRRLHDAASVPGPPRFVAEFDGDAFTAEEKPREALAAYTHEGRLEDARRARRLAFELALKLEDAGALRTMCADARWRGGADALSVYRAAKIVHDPLLLWNATVRLQWRGWSQPVIVPLALFAAAVWYVIVVHAAGAGRWRWLRPLTSVLAGVMSVWLLVWLQGLLQYGMPDGMRTASAGHEIVHWIMDVGLPEEAVKLLAFAAFIPVLLRGGTMQEAALLAGCTGLGFALDENLDYYAGDFYREGGGAAAIPRLVTANFLHIALTGIAGAWLFDLLRSKFHRTTEFITAFAGVAAAHGLYDWSSSPSAREWGGEILGILVLAGAAKKFFEKLRPLDAELRRHTVSCTAVFCFGGAILTGCVIICAAWQMGSLRGVTVALRSVVGIFPIALLYVREFREV